ncbi:hypothetical protein FB45DRAFT_1035443 [Roridomyces roridus]|uniref:F-box domain-containing protein n=1 Tax=Roridomyces roridus TaxID=1738132 RepID=A0AAD7FCA3_9AGAR|nr:hypothetical protein FB45DRAFT_1035443 [Roridomyces roridus]
MATRSIGAQLRQHLASLEQQITLLQSQIVALQADQKAAQEQLAAIVYPVLTLPNDITSEIFLQYSDDYPTDSCSPLLLARVCSSWRQVALSTHGIWAHFGCGPRYCSAPESGIRFFVPISGRLAIWLPRAGTLPLHIRIKLPDAEHPECARILKILGAYAAQWGTLDIMSDGPIVFPLQIKGPLPCLRRINLMLHPSSDGVTTIPTIHDAPHLGQVELSAIDLASHNFVLPWSQLTRLELDEMALAQCLDILAQTQSLEFLHFQLMDVDPDEPITSPPHVLPRVHSLSLGYDDSYSIVSHLTLPALRQLRQFSPTQSSAAAIEGLISRSSCSPTTLIMWEYDEEDVDGTNAWLAVMPTIQKLELRRLFNRIHDDTSFLPALTSLDINNCETRIELSPLVRMLDARRGGGGATAQLASFAISFEQERQDYYSEIDMKGLNEKVQGAINKLDELRAGGLNLDVRSSFKWFHEFVDSKMIEEIPGRS